MSLFPVLTWSHTSVLIYTNLHPSTPICSHICPSSGLPNLVSAWIVKFMCTIHANTGPSMPFCFQFSHPHTSVYQYALPCTRPRRSLPICNLLTPHSLPNPIHDIPRIFPAMYTHKTHICAPTCILTYHFLLFPYSNALLHTLRMPLNRSRTIITFVFIICKIHKFMILKVKKSKWIIDFLQFCT